MSQPAQGLLGVGRRIPPITMDCKAADKTGPKARCKDLTQKRPVLQRSVQGSVVAAATEMTHAVFERVRGGFMSMANGLRSVSCRTDFAVKQKGCQPCMAPGDASPLN